MTNGKTPQEILEEKLAGRISSYQSNKVDVVNELQANRQRLDSLPRDIFSGNDLVALSNILDETLAARRVIDPMRQLAALEQVEQIIEGNYIAQMGLDMVGSLPKDRKGVKAMMQSATDYFNEKNGYERERQR